MRIKIQQTFQKTLLPPSSGINSLPIFVVQMVSFEFFIDIKNPSDRTMALRSTYSLTEMSTRSISWEWKGPERKADNLTTILDHCHVIWEP